MVVGVLAEVNPWSHYSYLGEAEMCMGPNICIWAQLGGIQVWQWGRPNCAAGLGHCLISPLLSPPCTDYTVEGNGSFFHLDH